jgi:hypothetical protein
MPAEIVVTVGYWAMEWDGTMTTALDYDNIMVHGGVMMLVLGEGLVLNRIPLRLLYFGLLVLWKLGRLPHGSRAGVKDRQEGYSFVRSSLTLVRHLCSTAQQ